MIAATVEVGARFGDLMAAKRRQLRVANTGIYARAFVHDIELRFAMPHQNHLSLPILAVGNRDARWLIRISPALR